MLCLVPKKSNTSYWKASFLAVFLLATTLLPLKQKATAQSVNLNSGFSLGYLGDRFAQKSYLGYSFAVSFPASGRLRIGIAASFGNPVTEYDLVGFSGSQEIHVSSYELFLDGRFGSVFNAFDVSLRPAIGITTLATDERNLSVGALGAVKVPARSDRFVSYSVGLTATRELFPRVSAFLSPRASLISPVQVSSLGYSIVGGLSLGMF